MNQGLVSIAVLSLFLIGCDLGAERNDIKSVQTGHNKMADNKQNITLQYLDREVRDLETLLERAKNGLIPLDEQEYIRGVKEVEIRKMMELFASDPANSGVSTKSISVRLNEIWDGLVVVWNNEVDRFNDQLVMDTTNKEARIQDSEKTLDSISRQDAWEKTSSLRRMLEEQKLLIKQVRDKDIEKTIAEIENFIKDSEERLKNAIEARKRKDYELSHLHIERFYNRFYMIDDLMNFANTRIWTLRGNTSLLINSKIKIIAKVNKLTGDVENVKFMEPSEFEYLKTSPLSQEEGTKRAIELLDKAAGYLQEAIKEMDAKNYLSSHRLISKARRINERASNFIKFLKTRFPNTFGSPALEAKFGIYNDVYRDFLAKMEGSSSSSGSVDVNTSTWDKIKEIDSSLKKAGEVVDQVDREIGLYLKYRDREVFKSTSVSQSSIDVMKQESEMVKVSLDGSIVPYKQGDSIVEGEGIGYTYTSLAQLPSTDTGEAFNGLGGRKRRVVSSSVRVLNAQGLEVGTSFDKMYPVKGLKDEAKSGEFNCPLGGSFTSQDGLCLRQKGANTGAITAVITHFSTGG